MNPTDGVLCKICMNRIPNKKVFKISSCCHIFCCECLIHYIRTKVEENVFTVKCPEVDCRELLEPEICQDLISEELFERWASLDKLCAHCKVAWHSGLSCEEFARLDADEKGKEDLMFMEFAKSMNWKRCPRCKIYVERDGGCPHITCRCQYEFCYGCCREWSVICNGCAGGS